MSWWTCCPRRARRGRRLLHEPRRLQGPVHLCKLQRHAARRRGRDARGGPRLCRMDEPRPRAVFYDPGRARTSCEVHSMSMEFLAWPWAEGFFGEDARKFRYSHLAGALTFIPYGTMVDHFQHIVYAKPGDDPGASGTMTWKELARRLPCRGCSLGRRDPLLRRQARAGSGRCTSTRARFFYDID